ncbi:uncharacterized protein [Asterias amurensis]|uniref:uncharacterized protein n=1 Tax=Asterias amurensis TaxID=7602 RepID=UPI003AB1F50A
MDDDDVPPLEDMTELLQKAKQMMSSEESSLSSQSIPVKATSPNGHHGNASLSTSSREASESLKPKKETSPKETTKLVAPSGGFGGMKKGFLFGGPSNKTVTSSGKSKASSVKSAQKSRVVEEMPVIRPKEGSGDSKDRYRLDEVQEALKATAPLLQNKEWITDDLLTKLEKHPNMAKKLTDPRYAQAVAKFQSNPQQAMLEYKDNQDVQQFFKDFCGLLGEHFSSMGGGAAQPTPTPPVNPNIRTQDASSKADIAVRSSTNPNQATAADEAKMQQILSNAEIREIMVDQRIQRLMEALRGNPDEGQRILQSAGPDMRSKIHKLVEAGLLGFAS